MTTKVSSTLATDVWNFYIGEQIGQSKCMCCGTKDITQRNFESGHVLAVAEKGTTCLKNLRPICRKCNLSMGTKNMCIFMFEQGYTQSSFFMNGMQEPKVLGEAKKLALEKAKEQRRINAKARRNLKLQEQAEMELEKKEHSSKEILKCQFCNQSKTEIELRKMIIFSFDVISCHKCISYRYSPFGENYWYIGAHV